MSSYVHNAADAATGAIGVLVALEGPAAALAGHRPAGGDARRGQRAAVGRRRPTIPAAVLAEKRAELQAQARTSGKPAAVVEQMVEGRLRKFVDEVVLLRQPFIIDPDQTVEQALAAASADGAGAGARRSSATASAIR